MPPKKAAEPSKKTEMKKKEKIIEVAYMSSQLQTAWLLSTAGDDPLQ